jgi:hypothetical protein
MTSFLNSSCIHPKYSSGHWSLQYEQNGHNSFQCDICNVHFEEIRNECNLLFKSKFMMPDFNGDFQAKKIPDMLKLGCQSTPKNHDVTPHIIDRLFVNGLVH